MPQASGPELTIPSETEVAEEVAPEIRGTPPEVQSPTLMIQDVLGEIDPTGDAVDAPGSAEEEEEGGLSSTPEKDDAQDGKAAGAILIFDSPIKSPVAPIAMSSSLELIQFPP